MNKTGTVIIIFLVVIVSGVFVRYFSYQCTNDRSDTWDFHVIDSCALYFAQEGVESIKNVEQEGVLIHDADIPSFVEIEMPYGKDKEHVYYKGLRVTAAHPASFAHKGGEYYVDQTHVFWRGQQVTGAEPPTFRLFEAGDERFARDRSGEYFEGKIIKNAATTTNKRFLLSPYDGEEVTYNAEKEVFWRPSVEPMIKHILLALKEESNDIRWLFDDVQDNDGTYIWDVSAASTTIGSSYQMLFYAQTKGGMVRIEPPATFFVVENGTPGVRVTVEYSDDEVVDVSPDEPVYVSWAASNVERCYTDAGVDQPTIGHMIATFPVADRSPATEHIYVMECETSAGERVKDTVTIRSIREVLSTQE